MQIYCLAVWISEVQNGSHWAKIKVLAECFFFFLKALGESVFLPFPASRDHPCSSIFKANNIGPSLSHTVISLALLCLPLFVLEDS